MNLPVERRKQEDFKCVIIGTSAGLSAEGQSSKCYQIICTVTSHSRFYILNYMIGGVRCLGGENAHCIMLVMSILVLHLDMTFGLGLKGNTASENTGQWLEIL